mgnify:CR=1 FL=1|jgi:hypothetical protein
MVSSELNKEESPIDFVYLEYGENPSFDNFFTNSFIHFYMRANEFQDMDKDLRRTIAQNKCSNIRNTSKFIITQDKLDKNVFYSYVAFTLSENKLFIHMAYVKKNFRTFGFFKKSLDLLKVSANEYYYTLPLKLKRKWYLPEFERKVL